MGIYLNPDNNRYERLCNSPIFVDKSLLIEYTNKAINTSNDCICVTRPRRFGKSTDANMLVAYYSKGTNSKDLFNTLNINHCPSFLEHLNKHNVIHLNIQDFLSTTNSIDEMLSKINRMILKDLKFEFKDVITETEIIDAFNEVYAYTKNKFIFIIDEWDCIFREFKEDKTAQETYLDFLRSLLKDKNYIEMCYMTGILPIKRYNSQSSLNNFTEYNMLNPRNLTEFIGFTEEEVSELCKQYDMDINDMKHWYDGYHYNKVGDLYNPKSVVEALTTGEYSDYWVSTSSIEAVTNYMNYDNGELKDIIASLIAGNKVDVNVSRFRNDLTAVDNKDAALTVLIHLGYLAYDRENEQCYIPNYEIRQELNNGVLDLKWEEIEYPLINSKELIKQTVLLNTKYIEERLNENLEIFTTIYNRLDENVLSVLLNVSYDYARKEYNFFKEPNVGIGRADLILVPYRTTKPGIIFELKVDSSPIDAIKQIKQKNYLESFNTYKGKILLIGINLDSKTKKHSVLIEEVNK